MDAISGLSSDDAGADDFLIRIGHFDFESAKDGGNESLELAPGKPLANAAPRAMQEGDEAIITSLAAGIGTTLAQPALRDKLGRILAPDSRAAIHGPRRELDPCTLGDAAIDDVAFGRPHRELRVAHCFADGGGHRGIQAEGLVAHGVQEWQVVDLGWRGRGGVHERGQVCADFFPQACLDLGVRG